MVKLNFWGGVGVRDTRFRLRMKDGNVEFLGLGWEWGIGDIRFRLRMKNDKVEFLGVGFEGRITWAFGADIL